MRLALILTGTAAAILMAGCASTTHTASTSVLCEGPQANAHPQCADAAPISTGVTASSLPPMQTLPQQQAAAATSNEPMPAPVTIAEPPPTQMPLAQEAAVATVQLLPGRFYLNVASLPENSHADEVERILQEAKFPVLRQSLESNKGELVRLRVGPFETRKQAQTAQRKIKKIKMGTRKSSIKTSLIKAPPLEPQQPIAPPAKQQASSPVRNPTTLSTPKGFYVTAGAYAKISNADNVERILKAADLPVLRQDIHTRKGALTRMRAGPFDTRMQAQQALQKIQGHQLEARILEQSH